MPQTSRRKISDPTLESDATLAKKEKLKQYKKEYHIKNREKILQKVSLNYRQNKEKRLAYGQNWRNSNSEKMKIYRKKHLVKLKDETFAAYGGRICNCCGETQPLFLSIDHIEGGGNTHRKSLGNTGGKDFYTWLRKNGFPKGYQVLCFNCNLAKGHYGVCPHTTSPL